MSESVQGEGEESATFALWCGLFAPEFFDLCWLSTAFSFIWGEIIQRIWKIQRNRGIPVTGVVFPVDNGRQEPYFPLEFARLGALFVSQILAEAWDNENQEFTESTCQASP
ncbi:hypothetical protein [Cohaesibacter marisflavi]|uniref:hypothetical protein n=1 Tax=Cohaesibacter marisflavi TaxID=655353 RepID=UPI001587BB09|nr:hypothetical protein [Cohaesibacter marisflavi]